LLVSLTLCSALLCFSLPTNQSTAAAFLLLLFLASAGGLLPYSALPNTPTSPVPQTDKLFHLCIFFALTATFYFILDTTRRRVLHITLFVCTFALGVGSEVLQGLLPNEREFDPWDVLANVAGSLAALGLASAYHRRSVERRRRAKYSALTGEGIEGTDDLELGEAGVLSGPSNQNDDDGQQTPKTVQEELDNWDENAEDEAWDEEDDTTGASTAGIKITPASSSVGDDDVPKKVAID
jgi:VanZ family protein